MMMRPSICGTFLTDKRSLVAFTWSLTTLLTLVAFVMALVMLIQIHAHYKRLEHDYYQYANNNNDNNNNNNNGGPGGDGEENREEDYLNLTSMSSHSMTFVALYTLTVAVALDLYGSTAIVGFTSLRGVYIQPCFSTGYGSSKLRLGIFGGAIVLFANILLVCAVILGEVRVEDWKDRRRRDDMEPYEIERIATVLAVTCMFLSALYTIFAVLLFLYLGSEESELDLDEDGIGGPKPLRSISTDPRVGENFITMS